MDKFEQQIMKFIEETMIIEPNDRLLIACSGGVDSMALLYFFIEYKKIVPLEIVVAHVDHMLRGNVSLEDRHFVEDFCKSHQIQCEATSIPIARIIEEQGGNLQAICRKERYKFLGQVMQKFKLNKLVTAHHADDQLESFLMSLTKSPSLNGLQGIRLKRKFLNGHVVRPFLSMTKEDIKDYLQRKNGTFREDSSNEKDSYMRNRIRHKIVPILKAENVQVAQNAYLICKQLDEDEQYLMTLAHEKFQGIVKKVGKLSYELEISLLLKEAVALQRRLILILLNYLYNNTNTVQSSILCTSILNLIKTQNGSAMLNLPQGYIVIREYGKLLFQKEQALKKQIAKSIPLNEWTDCEGYRVYIGESSNIVTALNEFDERFYFDPTSIQFPIRLRSREDGDRIQLKGMAEKKRVSRLFIDEKVPLSLRDNWPILVDNQNELLAVLGIRVNSKFYKKKRNNEDYILIVERLNQHQAVKFEEEL